MKGPIFRRARVTRRPVQNHPSLHQQADLKRNLRACPRHVKAGMTFRLTKQQPMPIKEDPIAALG